MPTPLQNMLLRKRRPEGEGMGPGDPRMLQSATAALGFQPMQQRGPNYGRMGGGLFGMGVSTPTAIGYNPSYRGGMTPMMSKPGPAPQAQLSAPEQAAAGMLSDPSQGGQGFSGYSDPGEEEGWGGFGGWT